MGVVSIGLVSMGLLSIGSVSMGLLSMGKSSMSIVQIHEHHQEFPEPKIESEMNHQHPMSH